jgi:hypothetical protein
MNSIKITQDYTIAQARQQETSQIAQIHRQEISKYSSTQVRDFSFLNAQTPSKRLLTTNLNR